MPCEYCLMLSKYFHLINRFGFHSAVLLMFHLSLGGWIHPHKEEQEKELLIYSSNCYPSALHSAG